jgi:diaminopimelate decarboxylase
MAGVFPETTPPTLPNPLDSHEFQLQSQQQQQPLAAAAALLPARPLGGGGGGPGALRPPVSGSAFAAHLNNKSKRGKAKRALSAALLDGADGASSAPFPVTKERRASDRPVHESEEEEEDDDDDEDDDGAPASDESDDDRAGVAAAAAAAQRCEADLLAHRLLPAKLACDDGGSGSSAEAAAEPLAAEPLAAAPMASDAAEEDDLDGLLMAASRVKPGYAEAQAAEPEADVTAGALAAAAALLLSPAAAAAADNGSSASPAPPLLDLDSTLLDAAAAQALAAAAAAARATVEPPAALRDVLRRHATRRVARGDPRGLARAGARVIADEHGGGHPLADSFYVYDYGELARLVAAWRAALPRIDPFYAVKCNPEPALMEALAALGCGFDCASVAELKKAAAALEAAGCSEDEAATRVIFANPCKRPADFRYAREQGVRVTTFDTRSELEKVAALNPGFGCVLRIRCDDESSKINLGLKYGADPDEDAPALLELARDLGLDVVGVSFHVGSGCQNVGVYGDAIAAARRAFEAGRALGHSNMRLLDIGGGFTAPYDAANAALFARTAAVINAALDEHFPEGGEEGEEGGAVEGGGGIRGVTVIAEPGRYFAETTATLFACVIGQRPSRAAGPAQWFRSGAGNAPGMPSSAASLASAAATGAAAAGGSAAASPSPSPSPSPPPPALAPVTDYWLSDGTYGSFRILVAVDGLEPTYCVLRSPLLPAAAVGPSPAPSATGGASGSDDGGSASAAVHPARLWGNSDRDGDVVHACAMLPRLRDGDWLVFPFAGAYTLSSASNFGGVRLAEPLKAYVWSTSAGASYGAGDGACGGVHGQVVYRGGSPPPAALAVAEEEDEEERLCGEEEEDDEHEPAAPTASGGGGELESWAAPGGAAQAAGYSADYYYSYWGAAGQLASASAAAAAAAAAAVGAAASAAVAVADEAPTQPPSQQLRREGSCGSIATMAIDEPAAAPTSSST